MLGDEVFNEKQRHEVEGWERISEMENAVVYSEGASYKDIKQGKLGDCYFLSAISVLGDELVKEVIIDFDVQVGVYMFRFFWEGEEQIVIIDDWIPINA